MGFRAIGYMGRGTYAVSLLRVDTMDDSLRNPAFRRIRRDGKYRDDAGLDANDPSNRLIYTHYSQPFATSLLKAALLLGRKNVMRGKTFRTRSRNAVTIIEMLVATSLLVFAVSALGQFVSHINSGLRDRELSARIGWELLSARERIGTWPIERVTVEQIEQLPISAALANRLDEAKFTANVVQLDAPLNATQVALALECNFGGQKAQPSVLTFWVVPESEGGS